MAQSATRVTPQPTRITRLLASLSMSIGPSNPRNPATRKPLESRKPAASRQLVQYPSKRVHHTDERRWCYQTAFLTVERQIVHGVNHHLASAMPFQFEPGRQVSWSKCIQVRGVRSRRVN